MDDITSKKEKYNICMCCDFFYPRLGGVEMHIFQLSLGNFYLTDEYLFHYHPWYIFDMFGTHLI